MTDFADDDLLLVVDGNNIFCRAMYAFGQELATRDGCETGALYGAINYARQYVNAFDPTHVLWAFDWGKSNFRKTLRPEYKANRQADGRGTGMPSPLDIQMAAFECFLDMSGIAHYREHGVEADDIIAQVAIRESERRPVAIISSDHDLLQLVNDKILVVRPHDRSASPFGSIWGAGRVMGKYGLPPSKLASMWAIQGDTGDNIIGVKGIGPKRALGLMEKYSTLDKVVETLDPADRVRVLENRDLISLDGSLAHMPDVSLRFDKDDHDPEAVRSFLSYWEMESLAGQVAKDGLWKK